MLTPVPEDPYAEARDALDHGDAARARELMAKAYEANPADADIRELFTALQLAHAIRLSAQARDARRTQIIKQDVGYDEEFQDSPEVAAAFDRAFAAIEEVLGVDPGHEKALTAKAVLLFRRDRRTGRPAALEILRTIRARHPENRQAAFAIKKIEQPCARCSDTGFCPYCRARGTKRFLGIERMCEACRGQGICLVCGVL